MGNPWEIHGFPIRKWSENGMDHGFTRHKHLRFMDGLSGKMWIIFQPTHGVQGSDDGCWPMSEARSVLARCDATPVLFVVGRGVTIILPLKLSWIGEYPAGPATRSWMILENFKQKMETPVEISATRPGNTWEYEEYEEYEGCKTWCKKIGA